jgi:hypothetical protein
MQDIIHSAPALNHEPASKAKPAFRRPVAEQYRIHEERPFLASERATTTVLTGGLSPAHDYLVEAAMKSLGLKVMALPSPNLEA